MKYKIIITIILFIFSFLYLKNGIYIIRENDELMKIIKEKQDLYIQKPIDAIITLNTMIPGIKGRKVNLIKSYNKMKKINAFNESLLVFDTILPNKSIKNIYNKVILSGNLNINRVSIITKLDQKYCYVDKIEIQNECYKNQKYTVLITKITSNHLTRIKELLQNGHIYFLTLESDSKELDMIIKYIKNNNYEIVPINELINE